MLTARRGLIVATAVVASGLALTAAPAVAKVGPPITVVTTDPAPPGGKATFTPAARQLTVCDTERDLFNAVARLRVARTPTVDVPVSNACRALTRQLPPNTEVSLQVCLSRFASGGPLLSCSEWKTTRT